MLDTDSRGAGSCRAARLAPASSPSTPYLSRLAGVRGAAGRRQPGHPRHGLPRRRQRRPQHGRARRQSRVRAAAARRCKITNGHSVGGGLALHPALDEAQDALRPGQGRDRAGRRLPAGRPQPLRVERHLDPRLGRHRHPDDRLGRPLPRRPAEHRPRVAVRRGAARQRRTRTSAAAVSQASSLPLSINDAFGIDRDGRVRRPHVRRDDRDGRRAHPASARSATSTTRPQMEYRAARAAHRARLRVRRRSPPTSRQQLVLAAHLINANLGIRVVDTALDGFDTHSDQAGWHTTLMGRPRRRDRRVLQGAVDRAGEGQVTLMTFSEFGRRPEENGDGGTDHGTAAPLFVIGDQVKRRRARRAAEPDEPRQRRQPRARPSTSARCTRTMLRTWLKGDDAAILGKSVLDAAAVRGGAGGAVHRQRSSATGSPDRRARCAASAGHAVRSASRPTSPIVAGASTPTHHGLWLATAGGGIFCFGDAKPYGYACEAST